MHCLCTETETRHGSLNPSNRTKKAPQFGTASLCLVLFSAVCDSYSASQEQAPQRNQQLAARGKRLL